MAAPAAPSDGLFRAAADQAPQVMWIVNRKGAVIYLNQAWYALVGGSPPKWYGHEWGEVLVAEDLLEMRRRWTLANEGGALFEGMRRVRAVDGTIHVLAYKATPVRDPQGQVSCWVGMDADITRIMATEAALRFANQELEAFSFSVSHDLRAPLVTVQGFSTLLAKHLAAADDEKVRHYLGRISESVEHMGRLVDGLLVLSNVARAKLKIEEVDLSSLAAGIVELHRRRQPERAVTVVVQPGMRVKADARLLMVLMENLLGNAWKFTSRQEAACISVECASQEGGEVVFVVRDNGAGFDMAHAGQLFSAFSRLHAADEFPGTGIGLATVQRIVTRHGGNAWAQSEPGKGASIFFALAQHQPAGAAHL